MDLTVLLILFITYWVRPSGKQGSNSIVSGRSVLSNSRVNNYIKYIGGSPCSLMATASTNRKGDHKLQLQLQCGESTCRQFDCNDVNEELNISKCRIKLKHLCLVPNVRNTACTGQNCMKVNMYSVCDTPQGICVAPERENCEKGTLEIMQFLAQINHRFTSTCSTTINLYMYNCPI